MSTNMKTKNKKAMAMNTLVAITITLVSLVLIGFTVTKFSADADEKESEVLCHNSVALNASATLKIHGANIARPPIFCKTNDLTIEGNREEVKAKLAEKMARCWWMFNEARYDNKLSTTGDIGDQVKEIFGFGSDNTNQCFLCYTAVINSEDDLTGEHYITANELEQYLLETKHPKIKDYNYFDYFQHYGGPGAVALMSPIDEDYAYGIVFMPKITNDEPSWTWVHTAALTVGGVSCVVSAGLTCAVAATFLTASAYNAADTWLSIGFSD